MKKWTFTAHSYQIADTSDYDGHWEITNGIDTIIAEGDEEEVTELVEALNNMDKVWCDDSRTAHLEYENHYLKQQLSCNNTTTPCRAEEEHRASQEGRRTIQGCRSR